jgi:hypothetical protein
MNFPFYVRFGSRLMSAHFLFEVLAYAVAFRVYQAVRREQGLSTSVRSRKLASTLSISTRLIPFDTYNLFYRDDLESTRLAALRHPVTFISSVASSAGQLSKPH